MTSWWEGVDRAVPAIETHRAIVLGDRGKRKGEPLRQGKALGARERPYNKGEPLEQGYSKASLLLLNDL